MQQAKTILPFIQELLSSHQLTLNELDAIAFGCGPGSFTGTRIASCAAQGMGFAMQIPLIPISSLAILAQTAYQEHDWENSMVAVDARMGQVYWALYQVTSSSNTVTLINKELLCAPNDILLPETGDWHGVGDGWQTFSEIMIKKLPFLPRDFDSTLLPRATALLSLALSKLQDGDATVAPAAALPSYLR